MITHSADEPGDRPAERLAELLHRELRTAGSAAQDDGATVDEVTADLTDRLKRLRKLNADGWHAAQPRNDPPDRP